MCICCVYVYHTVYWILKANPSSPNMLEKFLIVNNPLSTTYSSVCEKSMSILKHSAALIITVSLQMGFELKYLIFLPHSMFSEMAHSVIMIFTLIPFPHGI